MNEMGLWGPNKLPHCPSSGEGCAPSMAVSSHVSAITRDEGWLQRYKNPTWDGCESTRFNYPAW